MAKLYAIAGNMERARLMLAAGVPYLQVRFKETPLARYRMEIAGWPARFPATRIVINDELTFAEQVGAWGAHLGQQDLKAYAPQVLRETPLALGISTHSDAEISAALGFFPALLGFGPIFPTGSKNVVHPPQGVERLAQVVRAHPVPVVAIGGITDENLDSVVATGVPLVAMISHLEQFRTPADLGKWMARLA